MQTLTKILDKISTLKARNQRLFSPLLNLPDSDLMPYEVSDSGLTRSDLKDKIRKIESCAGLVEFRTRYVPDSTGVLEQQFKIHNATYCRHYTVCEICSRRVQLTRWKRFRPRVEELSGKYRYIYHVTFTIEDKNNLGERIDFLNESFRSFVRQGQKRGRKKGGGEWSKVGAAIVATENKRGENSDLWHVHKHALIFCHEPLDFRVYDSKKVRALERLFGKGKVPKDRLNMCALNLHNRNGKRIAVSKLSLEWLRATKGEALSVHARRLRGNVNDIAQEVLKYPVKVSLKSKLDIPYIIEQTYNRRFLATYGELRGLQDDEYTLDETKDSKEIYLSQWTGYKYSDLVPGPPIAFLDDDIKKKIFSRMAKLTGHYRSQRKSAIGEYFRQKIKVLSDLESKLNFLKVQYRSGIAAINSHFARMPNLPARIMPRWSRSSLPDAEQTSLVFSF